MIKSMTAFGNAEKIDNGVAISVEVRSYNSRYLDVSLNLPHEIRQFEEKIRLMISGRVNRGRVEVRLRIEDEAIEKEAFEVDIQKAGSYRDALIRLKKELDLDITLSIDFLAGPGGIFKPVENEKDADRIWNRIEPCLKEALDGLDDMRCNEGAMIAKDLEKHLNNIETAVREIEEVSENLLPIYRDRLKRRMEELTQAVVEIDPDRIAQEAAFLAEKSDISEEIVRMDSHIKQFRSIQHSTEPAGRKMNFLLQELGREINTMGSKTGKSEVSHLVVDVKSELEKMREQIQNVE